MRRIFQNVGRLMATQENSTGLLSKVAKFVRNPTTEWSDLDKTEAAPVTGYNKQVLKNMIERKRHDDGIRKREFDYLRKLRKNASVISASEADKISLFRVSSNFSGIEERAVTLKKIDEIEAQMSKQWWKARTGHAQSGSVVPEPSKRLESKTVSMSFLDSESSFVATQVIRDHSDFDDEAPTLMGMECAEPVPEPLPLPHAHVIPSENISLTAPKVFAEVTQDGLSDPELEEAAIRFANGDDAGAEATLLCALQSVNGPTGIARLWSDALFDMYRSTGQQASFENLALDYSQRFKKTAPAWLFSPSQADCMAKPMQSSSSSTVAHDSALIWRCPARLDAAELEKLESSPVSTMGSLNWSGLKSITPAAARVLATMFAKWCDQPVTLHFEGVEVLSQMVRAATPVGLRQTEQFWWQLRLDMLRVLRLQDDFELASIDYCLTYEVSPPPWRNVHCHLLNQFSDAVPNAARDGKPAFDRSELSQTDYLPEGAMCLSGELLGDVTPLLLSLETESKYTKKIVISCNRLIRVDFSAAGSILNWVANAQAQGGQIEFQDVPCLVATFFNLIGISEHVRVISRKN